MIFSFDLNDPQKKSLLDYIVMSSKLSNKIKLLRIDSALNFTPRHHKDGNLKFPDHWYSKICQFQINVLCPLQNLQLGIPGKEMTG